MPRKSFTAEEIIRMLREAEVDLAQGQPVLLDRLALGRACLPEDPTGSALGDPQQRPADVQSTERDRSSPALRQLHLGMSDH